jgi:hypothetical protein
MEQDGFGIERFLAEPQRRREAAALRGKEADRPARQLRQPGAKSPRMRRAMLSANWASAKSGR